MDDSLRWCNSVDDVIGLLAYVAVYAPDEFPDEDGDTLDLEGAFLELRHGLTIVSRELTDGPTLRKLDKLLSDAHQQYLANDIFPSEMTWKAKGDRSIFVDELPTGRYAGAHAADLSMRTRRDGLPRA